jgi:hypothetical protein
MKRLVRAWLLIGVVDALWAVALTFAYGGAILRLWQGVASVPFGKGMVGGGIQTALLGLVVHFGVALAWSAIFLLVVRQWAWLRGVVNSRYGVITVAVVYGPLIWITMSLVAIPAVTRAMPTITYRWWIQLAGHVVFVGLPIVWAIRDGRD